MNSKKNFVSSLTADRIAKNNFASECILGGFVPKIELLFHQKNNGKSPARIGFCKLGEDATAFVPCRIYLVVILVCSNITWSV